MLVVILPYNTNHNNNIMPGWQCVCRKIGVTVY